MCVCWQTTHHWKLLVLVIVNCMAERRLPALGEHIALPHIHHLLIKELTDLNSNEDEFRSLCGLVRSPVT